MRAASRASADLVLRPLEGEEGPRVAGVETARAEQLAQLAGQAQQAQRVGDGGAVAAHLARDLFLGEVELLLEPVEGLGLLERGQLLALDVLDEGQLEQPLVGHLAHGDGDGGQPEPAGRRASAARRR